ncbi:hypothetical protein [Arthrobacter sp. TB 26]|uniref:hypothetical protein n=1 Tax=Arthrobacter sp. TB 26 TaxID=494420 RepID=UPI00040310AA|nr:hypothetical protein [Arthrobacter sp. TB 26]
MGSQHVSVPRQAVRTRAAYSYPAIMSIATWEHWLIRRHLLETETPGRFGYFNDMEGAA